MTSDNMINGGTPYPEGWPLRYFDPTELRCRGDHTMSVPLSFALKVDMLRHRMGRPLIINSWFRSAKHNAAVGGAKNSWHLRGRAVDISTVGWSAEDIARLLDRALQEDLPGHGIYPRFVHLDEGKRRVWWGS